MHATRGLLLGLSLLHGTAAALRVRSDGPVEDPVPAPGSKTFIVELAKGSDIEATKRKLTEKSGTVVLKTLESDVFTGLTVETTDNNVESLEALVDTVKAWPMRRIEAPDPKRKQSFATDASAPEYSIHQFTGVDKAHADGVFGKGVVVGVVDTGIDYTHPALGAGFGPGFKVAGGYDLVGDGNYPTTPREPDDDPVDKKGHGTHVAGIIAGKTEHFVGVAPEATLRAYKVFTANDLGTREDVLIEAFLMAYKDGVDIITSSIGGIYGWADGAWASVASRIVDTGVVVTISASNQGTMGPFLASSGSSGRSVIAVASVEAGNLAADPFLANFTVAGETNMSTLAYVPGNRAWNISGYSLVPTSLDSSVTDDACRPLPSGFPSLNGSVALVRRGGCDYAVKQANVEAAGAKYLLIYNTDDRQWAAPYSPKTSSQLALIDSKAGSAIVATIAAGGSVTVDFATKTSYKVGVHNSAGGLPNDFTSWGPLFDLQIKPNVAAPGGDILSTFPGNGWEVLSGTSMSCPYVAGIAALYISKHGGRKAHGSGFGRQMFQRIISSGGALPWATSSPLKTGVPNDDQGFFAPVAQVGSGMVDAAKVLGSATTLRFDPFALNDTANFAAEHEVAITNGGDAPVEYRFELQPAAGFEMFQPYNQFGARNSLIKDLKDLSPIPLVPDVAMPAAVTLAPGETRNVSFRFTPPTAGVNTTQLPVYSGKVLVTGSNGDALSVPYLGAAFSLLREINPIFRKGSPELSWRTSHTEWTFDLNPAAPGYPIVFMALEFGVTEVRWDVFESGWAEDRWSYPPVVGENGYVGSATSYSDTAAANVFDPASMQLNDTFSFPVADLTRAYPGVGTYSFWWLGALGNGSQINSGTYKIRFAALRPFADPKLSESWSVWNLPEIKIKRLPSNVTASA